MNILINQSDGGKDGPADRLFALVLLWNGRASDLADRASLEETPAGRNAMEGAAFIWRKAAADLLMALDVIYPDWRAGWKTRMGNFVPKHPDDDEPQAA